MTVPEHLRVRIRAQAGARCGYCPSAQRYVFAPLEIEHLVPTMHGGTDATEHFAWSADGTQIAGQNPCGVATIAVLRLNNVSAVMVRREWVAAEWHPPE